MKTPVVSTLLLLGLAPALAAQASFGVTTFTPPQGWTHIQYPDGVVYTSQLYNNGERCQVSVFAPRPATGNLAVDARQAYQAIFQLDPAQNAGYPFPPLTLYRGIAAQGWEYFVIKRSIRGRVGEYGSLLGTTLLVAQLGRQVAVVTSTGKDPLVSMCMGELVHDEWPRIFHSLRFQGSAAAAAASVVRQRLAGQWTTATATVADRYTFTPSGRFASAAAAMSRTRLNDAQVLQTTSAYFGDGAFTIAGNLITLTADQDRAHPAMRRFRLEQESADGGATWTDRLCLLDENVGEVCYRRDR